MAVIEPFAIRRLLSIRGGIFEACSRAVTQGRGQRQDFTAKAAKEREGNTFIS